MIVSERERLAFQKDPCLPGHLDPYPIYAALLEESSVQWCEGPGLWIVLGHPDCEAHMRDDRCSRQDHLDKLIRRFGDERIFQRQKGDLPFMDDEVHGRVRNHVMIELIFSSSLWNFATRDEVQIDLASFQSLLQFLGEGTAEQGLAPGAG